MGEGGWEGEGGKRKEGRERGKEGERKGGREGEKEGREREGGREGRQCFHLLIGPLRLSLAV